MNVTIKDVAKAANVSHTTVSRALNNSPLISEKTKLKIRALAEQMGYTPNISAKSLVTLRSYHLGLFFSTLRAGTSAGFLYDTLRGVNLVCGERYHLVVKGIDDLQDLRMVNRQNFDGIVVMSQSGKDDPFIAHVADSGIPLAVLGRQAEGRALINIVSDDAAGAYAAVTYAIRSGHRHIAMIEGKPGFRSADERRKGYRQALRDAAGDPKVVQGDDALRAVGNYDVESGYRAMKELIAAAGLRDAGKRPTAVFCGNDEMAVGAMKALHESGIPVPAGMSIIGFDDSAFCAYLTPALTTVKRPIEQIARIGTGQLLEWMEKASKQRGQTVVGAELVVRDSVCPPQDE